MSHQVLGGEYLTRPELAAELGVSERTIWRWDSARVGPPRTALGRRIVYRRVGVTQWLRDREIEQVRDDAKQKARANPNSRANSARRTRSGRRLSNHKTALAEA